MIEPQSGHATLVVRAAIAPLHAEPRVSSPQISQRLAGHRLTVLAADGEWSRVRGHDAYEGWVHRGYVRDERAGEPPPARLSLGCVVRDRTCEEAPRRAVPLGAWLADDDLVAFGDCVSREALGWRFPREPGAIVRTAVERFAGTPYQWGGITPWGADCSGLVQAAFALHDVALPRDAWQQAECGEPVADGLQEAGAGDLLFFSSRSDRRITHVGVACGERGMVHLAVGRGGYAVERLDDETDPYLRALRERYVCARRLLPG